MWVVGVTHLVERSLTTPEAWGSNWVICKIYIEDENKEKESGNGPFLKKPEIWCLVVWGVLCCDEWCVLYVVVWYKNYLLIQFSR